MKRRTFLELLAAGVITAAASVAAVEVLPRLFDGPERFGFGKMGKPLSPIKPDTHVYPSSVPFIFEKPIISQVPIPFGTITAIHD